MRSYRVILHPTDFSDNSRSAFESACSLARDHDATLVLLHVMPPAVGAFLPATTPDPLRPLESQKALPWQYPWPRPDDPPVRVEHRVAEGDAPAEILHLAGALPCDLIVMGTHGRTGLNRLLAGSVAEEVLRKAACPVMVVRTPLAGAPPVAAPAKAGEVVDVRPLGSGLASAQTKALAQSGRLEVIRLVVPAGEEIDEPKVKGETAVQCLEGRVACTALGKTQDLEAGRLLCLPGGEPYTLRGIEGASLLVTTFLPKG
jgi:nucleotide-binding universal stress UspA family protein/quercetin dioxygenase-like cupin family protein